MSDPRRDTLRRNLDTVRSRLADACARAGRPTEAVTLVAVTKTVDIATATVLAELGVADCGENRPQELWRKAAEVPGVRWHLIGHLQRNKVERTLPVAHLIHSVDSLRLLGALEAEAERQGRGAEVLLEVNASREASKHGFAPEEIGELASAVRGLRRLRVRGLMTMAAYDEEPERCRPTFALTRELRDRLREQCGDVQALDYLSMGMSNDYVVAVEEGATHVRVGSALFEGLPEAGR